MVLHVLLQRRWLVLTGVLLLVVVLCVRLGFWQLERHQDRRAYNAVVDRNYGQPAAPVDDLMRPDRLPTQDVVWRAVRATGTYDPARTVLLRNQTHDGTAGVAVLVPLRTADGTAVLVDRGFVPRGRSATSAVDVPAPPSGEASIVGHITRPVTARTTVIAGVQASVGQPDVATIARWLPYPVYGGIIDLVSEQPPPAEAPVKPEEPQLGFGPHLSYAIEWWFFAALAVVGWIVLFRRDLQEHRAGAAPSQPKAPHRAVTSVAVERTAAR